MATVVQNDKSGMQQESEGILSSLLYPKSGSGMPKFPAVATIAILVIGGSFFGVYRWYQQTYSFSVGMDYFEPEFDTYWMNLLYAQLVIIALVGSVGSALVWFSRPDANDVAHMEPLQELSIYNFIFALMAAASFFIVVILAVFVEADAAWHQVTIRDTDFTPTHIGLFYMAIPLGMDAIILGWIWVHTRMPDFQNRVSIPLCLVAMAPILIMPNLGLNEWGHTFFYAEELFAAPIHWGFVTMGWGLFGMAGFILQCLARVRILTSLVGEEGSEKAAA
ncbi:MAG: hypothetical protein COB04_13355 [Gammaproteobacteria bacterium]|nr:MAG: hypothetical protein COB04_13355 [Gammaproteobacteria bacterium]